MNAGPHTLRAQAAPQGGIQIYLIVFNASQAVRRREYFPHEGSGSHKETTTRPSVWRGGYLSLTETGPNIFQLLVHDHGQLQSAQLESFKNDDTPISNAFDLKRHPMSAIPLQRLGNTPWLESRKFGFHRTSFDIYDCQRSQHFFERSNVGSGRGLVFLKMRYTYRDGNSACTFMFPTFIHSKIPYQKHSQLQQINNLFNGVDCGRMEPLEKVYIPEHPNKGSLFDGKFILGIPLNPGAPLRADVIAMSPVQMSPAPIGRSAPPERQYEIDTSNICWGEECVNEN